MPSDPPPSTSNTASRRRGRPRRPAPPKLEDSELCRVVKRFSKIEKEKLCEASQRYWDITYEGIDQDGKALTVNRQLSIYEVHSKVQRIVHVVGASSASDIPRMWEQLSADQRNAIAKIVSAVSRSERPRSVAIHRYSWRTLDHKCFSLVRDAEQKGQCFAALPSFAELQEEMGVGLRALQKSIVRMRKEAQESPGLRVHVDFWMGEPPTGYTGPIYPWLWVSRWGARTAAEAAVRGLLPASTNQEAAHARSAIWDRLASRN